MPISYYYKPSNIDNKDNLFIADGILLFSKDIEYDNNLDLAGVKFYYDGEYISSNPDGNFIGYCVSGDVKEFDNQKIVKTGHIENWPNDLLRAIKYLANHLNEDITNLPISLYVVGQAALLYWDRQYRTTQDIDVYRTESEDLFEQKKFLDLIKETDRAIKNLKENSDDRDLIINNDASKTGNFVFPITWTKHTILEGVLDLYFADEESAKLNKTYAYYVELFEEGRERVKDKYFVKEVFASYGINSKEKLFKRWPVYRDINENAMKWDSVFEL